MGAPARGSLCAPCPRVDMISDTHVIFRPSSAFLPLQNAIVTARAGLLTQARLRRDAPEATAVASELLQTRARPLPKRAVREVRILPGNAREAALQVKPLHPDQHAPRRPGSNYCGLRNSCRHARGTSGNVLCAKFAFRLTVHEKLRCTWHPVTSSHNLTATCASSLPYLAYRSAAPLSASTD